MALEQWEIDLRNQLGNKADQPQSKSDEPQSENVFLLMTFVVLSIICLAAYLIKTDYFEGSFEDKAEKIEEKIEEKPKFTSEVSKSDLEKLAAKVKRQDEQISVMGIMMNENFVILRDNEKKSDLIFLNRDWKLKKSPSHIQLDDLDKEFLKNNVVQ